MWLAGWLFIHHLSSWYYWICRDPIDNRDRRHAPFFGISVSDKQLEHLQQCSVRDPAQYKWMKKIQRMPVWLRKIVLAQHNCAGYYHGWYEAQQRCAPEKKRKKSAINVIWLLLSVSDWPRSFVISPPPICYPSLQFYWWGYKRLHNWTWMWKIFAKGHILSTAGGCCRVFLYYIL